MMNRPYQEFAKGGLKDEGGEIDPVSGNEVPVGGTKKGVRDDVDVNMSEGEFVFPEDVTRYHGLEKLMNLRQEAKAGLKQMDAMGMMGNGDEAILPDDIPFGLADLMVVSVGDGGEEEELNMAEGGVVSNRATGTFDVGGSGVSVTGQQPTGATPQNVSNQTPMIDLMPQQERPPKQEVDFDAVMGDNKLEFKEYRNAEGQSLMVPFIGGVAMYPIPEGYTLYTGEGSETGETDLPDTGADAITPSSDDDDRPRIQADKPEPIDWENLDDQAFIEQAGNRMGFARTLATGFMTAVNPIAGLAMSGMMKFEDKRVLEMMKSRLPNIKDSVLKASYEKQIEEYEARSSGLFGGILGGVITKIGEALNFTKEQIEKALNANLVGQIGTGKPPIDQSGNVTPEAATAVETGSVTTSDGTIVTKEDYMETMAAAESTDPNVAGAAREKLANYLGDELGGFVNPTVMNMVREGAGDLTPEETRLSLVNSFYQKTDSVKAELDALPQNAKDFLGLTDGIDPAAALAARNTLRDPNARLEDVIRAEETLKQPVSNYLDIVDYGREQVSQILPTDFPRTEDGLLDLTNEPQRKFRSTPSVPTGEETVMSQPVKPVNTLEQTLTAARNAQVQSLVYSGLTRSEAEERVPDVSKTFVEPAQTGLEAFETSLTQPKVTGSTYDEAGVNVPSFLQPRDPKGSPQKQTAKEYSDDLRSQGIIPSNLDMKAAGFTDAEIASVGPASSPSALKVTIDTPTQTEDVFKIGNEGEFSGTPIQKPTVEEQMTTAIPSYDEVGINVVQPTVTTPIETELPDARDAAKKPTVVDKTKTPLDKLVEKASSTTKVASTMSFADTFAAEKAKGKDTFTYDGKQYTTETAAEKKAREKKEATPKVSDPGYMIEGAGYTTINGKMPTKAQQKEQREAAAAAKAQGKNPQEAVSKLAKTQASSGSSDKSSSSSTSSSGSTKSKSTNIASSGRSEADIQADINKELSGGGWTEKANELVKERDSARANEGSSSSDSGGSSSSSSSDSGGSCFLTTAIVEKRGEADDGVTLTKLRNFRDTYLKQYPEEITKYYDIAPKIVSAIPSNSSSWDWVGKQIDKSVYHIDRKENKQAYLTYKNMVDTLEREWL